MSFRQFGGLNYAPKHNIVASNYNTSNNLLVTQNVGQPNSYINFLSDISGNIRVYGDFDLSGNLNVSGDVDISGNLTADYMFLSSYPPNFSNQANAVMPKAYIDALTGGVVPFGAVKAISTYDSSSNNTPGFYPVPLTTFTSIFQIDGYTPSVGDLVLLNDQGTSNGQNPAILNGIYQLTGSPGSYSYVRSSVMPDGTDAKRAGVTVQQGISNQRELWVQTQDMAIVGQDPLLWTIFFSFNYALGQGLSIANAPNNKEVLFVDSSLNFLTLVDASSSFPTLNIGTENALTITMGKLNGSTTTNINGTTTFNTSLPTSTQTPSSNSQLTTKTYVDSSITSSTTNLLAANNTWTGTTTFSSLLTASSGLNVSSGNVGIGTTSSSSTLDVRGGTSTVPVLNVENTISLPNTIGSYNSLSSLNCPAPNNFQLNTYQYRNNNWTTSWESSSTRIQSIVDVIYKGYIEFNPSTLDGASNYDGGVAIKGYNVAALPSAITNGGLIVSSSGSVYIAPNANLVPYFQSYTDLSSNYLYFQKNISNSFYDLGLKIGSVSVWNISSDGTANFSGIITNTVTQPASNDSSTKVPTTAWVQSAITSTSGAVPLGTIVMWSGTSIPYNWQLCDGSNGTPDLRDRFIVGAGSSYLVGNTGGQNSVTLSISQLPSHSHVVNDPGHHHQYDKSGTEQATGNDNLRGSDQYTSTNTTTHITGITIAATGDGNSHENRPPYYALSYIMRMS
jgi:microcystin-dependent protein